MMSEVREMNMLRQVDAECRLTLLQDRGAVLALCSSRRY